MYLPKNFLQDFWIMPASMPACDGSRRKAAGWPPETMLRAFTGRFGGIFLTLKHYKMKSLCAEVQRLCL
jgi:hypothetical protein